MTKQEAIELWDKFINSNNVRKSDLQTSMSFISYYTLTLYAKDLEIAQLNLEALGKKFLGMDQSEYTYSWKNLPNKWKYKTPYGEFELTIEESNLMLDKWLNRHKMKEQLSLEELKKYL